MSAHLASSDFGFVKEKLWRPAFGTGFFHGIPVSGKAIATDGVLLVVEREDGQLFVGHLANFVRPEKPKALHERKKKEDMENAIERERFE